jgi:hypothetical protein
MLDCTVTAARASQRPAGWRWSLEQIVTEDIGGRGIASDADSLVTRTCGQLASAAQHLADHATCVALATGFFVANGTTSPTVETDGPPGVLTLARVFRRLGVDCVLITDPYGSPALRAAIDGTGESLAGVPVYEFPFEHPALEHASRGSNAPAANERSLTAVDDFFRSSLGRRLSHLVSVERAGPSHTTASQRGPEAASDAVFEHVCPPAHQNHVHNFRGEIITPHTAKIHLLFEMARRYVPAVCTMGVGDGGNEIGMGSIPWRVIQTNVTGGLGGLVACRIATDWTITSGVSNWGAWALAAACARLRNRHDAWEMLSPPLEQRVLGALVGAGRAVDGVTRRGEMSVDGLPWDVHAAVLERILAAVSRGN